MATKSNQKDQASLVKVLNRLASALESQRKTLDTLSTTQSAPESKKSSKASDSTNTKSTRQVLQDQIDIEESKEREADIERELLDLQQQSIKNSKLIGTEKFKQVDVARLLTEIQSKEIDLVEEILDLQKQGKTEQALKLVDERKSVRNQKNILKTLKEQSKAQEALNKSVVKASEKLTEKINNLKNPIDYIGKKLQEKVTNGIMESAHAASQSGKQISSMGIAVKQLAGAAGVGLLISGFKMLWDSITSTNDRLVELQRNFGISRVESQKINKQIAELAGNTSIVGANTETLTQAYADLASVTGQTNIANKEMLETQVLLTKQLGMTGQEAASFQSISVASGQTANQFLDTIDQVASKYEKITGDTVNQAELAKDLAKTSKKTLATFKGDVKALTAAAIQAKKMGMSLEDTQQTADKLLNIESSLQAEMQANVLTGKSMNMNQARLLALQGKTSEAAAEAVKQAGSYDEFMKMAPYQQQAVADAAGMTVDQLVKAGELQKFSSKLAGKEIKAASDLTEEDIKKLETTKAITAEKAAQLRKDKQSATFQENMAKLMDKLKAIFNQLAGKLEPVLDMLGNGISKFLDGIVAAKDGFKNMIPPGIKDLLNSDAVGNTAAIGGTIAAAVGVGKLVKSFFGKKKPEEEVAENTLRTAENTEGLGGGKVGGSGSISEAGAGPSKAGGGGMLSKLKDKFAGSKLGKKFAESKVGKFAQGAMGFLGKTGLGSMASGMISDATGIDVGGMLGGGGGADAGAGGGNATKELAESSKSGAGKLSGGGGGAPTPSAPKKSGGFFSKIGSFISEKASKLNPLNALKGAFKGPGLKKILGKIPKIGSIVSAAMSLGGAVGAGGADPQEVGKQVIMAIGDMGGTFLGGLLGSIIPGAGTMIGGFLGGMGGSAIAGLIADNADVSGIGKMALSMFGGGDATASAAGAAPSSAGSVSASSSPASSSASSSGSSASMSASAPASTSSSSVGAVSTGGGGSVAAAPAAGGNSEVASLLKQLIAKVDQPVQLTIGSKAIKEIGTTISLNRSISAKADKSYSVSS